MAMQKDLEYTILFNFNGAEEAILQAAHGFITKHRWADDVIAFVNMDAGGISGKEV